MTSPSWIVVSDFDGTLTEKDIGNELCLDAFPDHFRAIHRRYKNGELDLKTMQKILWENFPYSESKFTERALHFASLRPGVNDFLEKCLDQNIPVYVASCGLQPYITPVLDKLLRPRAHQAVLDLRCNRAEFDEEKISRFIPPQSRPESPYPLDKGEWARELAQKFGPQTKILGIGNGSSDRSMVGAVHLLAATEGLAEYCTQQKQSFRYFDDFTELLNLEIFSR